jgi:hypothetical protein
MRGALRPQTLFLRVQQPDIGNRIIEPSFAERAVSGCMASEQIGRMNPSNRFPRRSLFVGVLIHGRADRQNVY